MLSQDGSAASTYRNLRLSSTALGFWRVDAHDHTETESGEGSDATGTRLKPSSQTASVKDMVAGHLYNHLGRQELKLLELHSGKGCIYVEECTRCRRE